MLRLVTIPISHYCEKARWALERAGLEYREERHVQGIHRFYARRAGGGVTVPVLVTDTGAIGESEQILDWVDARLPAELRLLPEAERERSDVRALSRRFDECLGPAGRRLMYVHMLPQRELALSFNNHGVPPWEDRALRWGWPMFSAVIERALGIRPGIEVQDEAIVWREFDFVAETLGDGRPYLCGERFGAADLTFAALAAAVTAPETYGVPLPQPEQLLGPIAAIVRRARDHPSGRYALRIVSEQRGTIVAEPAATAAG
ncbi:MAG TPA: glutathione S-transferase N-terminal domain-containing protein [Solirubrobacteraceae bacterium]|nr:glutathione S-transferase N-terminal domain-containing protein [Solirubrobacteraceae bacterium]